MADKKNADAPIINPEADRILGRMSIQAIVVTIVLVTFVTMFVPLANDPQAKSIFPYHRLIDALSVAVVIVPFFLLTNRVYAGRLRIGRDLEARGEHRQAIAALEPFNYWHQRFLDSTGEAHFLLAKAYDGIGQKDKAKKCRDYVLRSRRGPWADALAEPPSTPVRVSEIKQKSPGQGGSRSKPSRRF